MLALTSKQSKRFSRPKVVSWFLGRDNEFRKVFACKAIERDKAPSSVMPASSIRRACIVWFFFIRIIFIRSYFDSYGDCIDALFIHLNAFEMKNLHKGHVLLEENRQTKYKVWGLSGNQTLKTLLTFLLIWESLRLLLPLIISSSTKRVWLCCKSCSLSEAGISTPLFWQRPKN